MHTHLEQWAADVAAPGEQLGVRCLAQGSHLSRGQFLPEPRFDPTASGYKSDPLSIRATTPFIILHDIKKWNFLGANFAMEQTWNMVSITGERGAGNGKPRMWLEWSDYRTLSAREEIAVTPLHSYTRQKNTLGWFQLLFLAGFWQYKYQAPRPCLRSVPPQEELHHTRIRLN